MKNLWSVLLLLVFIAATPSMAQTKLPADPNVRIGTLPNGLTYYIRHHELPKGRAEFRIAQAVGAILEEDNQKGLAHFLEHMAFNGTKNFPGKNLINYFELNRVNINAFTSLDKTEYRLSNVPTANSGLIDSALLVMHDWSSFITLAGEEIDNERGVIREEWHKDAMTNKKWRDIDKQKYIGSQYAKRDVIGDTAVINNFSYQELRDFYHKWYGPDLQAIIIVGDINVDEIEAKLKELFADVPARSNRGERPIYKIPGNTEPIVAIVLDDETLNTHIDMEFKNEPPTKEKKLSIEGYIEDLMNRLVSTMMGYRFDKMATKPEASFMGAYAGYGSLFKTVDAFRAYICSKEGQGRQAMEDLMIEIERMDRYGFTNSELERAKIEMLATYDLMFYRREKVDNFDYAQKYIRNFLDHEPIPGIETEYEIVKAILPKITTAMVNELASSQITEENLIISVMAPNKSTVKLPDAEQTISLWNSVQKAEIAAPVEEVANIPLVEKAPKVGEINKVTTNASLGTTEWLLSNGVKVVIKPTNFKQDEILMSSESDGGMAYVANLSDIPSLYLALDIVASNGIGNLSYFELKKALIGKNAHVSPFISQYSEGMSGSSTIKDFETLLQLIYLYHTSPRKEYKAYAILMSTLQSALAKRETDPKQIFSDSIQATMNSHNPRFPIFDLNTLAKVDQDRALAIYTERFANPADFTFYFVGNIDPNNKETQKLIATWLGGMKTKKNREVKREDGSKYPLGYVNNTFSRDMQIHTASNRIVYTGNMPFTLQNKVVMSAISDILSIRYLESIREKEGGSYGVGTAGFLTNFPTEQATLIMQFDTDPEKQAKIIKIIYKEIEDIINNGPREDDLKKVKESMLKDYEENLQKNNYWMTVCLGSYYNDNMNYVTGYKEVVNNITPALIVEALKNLVDQRNIAEVVMMPK